MFLGRWLGAFCRFPTKWLWARHARTHLLRIIGGMADMMCTLNVRFQDVGYSMDDGTYGPETGILDRLGVTREGLCDDGDVVSTLLLDLYRGRETHDACSDGGCEEWGCFAIGMGSPAPMTTTFFGALDEAMLRDLRGGLRVGLVIRASSGVS